MIQKLRSQQITIELPKEDSDVFIRATLQRVIKNDAYETVQLVDRVDAVHRELSQTLMETVTFVDPITQQPLILHGATIAAAVTAAVVQWILEDHPDYQLNEHGDIVKES